MIGGIKMRNLIKILLFSIFMSLSFSTLVHAENTVISVGDIMSKTAGKTVSLPINIRGNVGISSFGMSLTYDNKYFSPVKVTNGIWDSNSDSNSYLVFNKKYKGSENTVFVAGAGKDNKVGNGALFYIHFDVIKDIDEECTPFELTVEQLRHREGETTKIPEVPYKLNQGTISLVPLGKTKIGFSHKSFILSDTISVPVEVTNNNGISTFAFCVNYDKNLLTPISISKGIWNSEPLVYNLKYGENKIFITGASSENKAKDGAFVYINFKVNKKADLLSSELSLEVKQLKRSIKTGTKMSLSDIEYNEVKGDVKLSNCDINGDGNIDAADASLVLQYVLDRSSNNYDIGSMKNGTIFGDINNNGIINAVDAALILGIAL